MLIRLDGDRNGTFRRDAQADEVSAAVLCMGITPYQTMPNKALNFGRPLVSCASAELKV